MIKKTLAGNDAVAEAMRQINPDVVAAYPITPSTHIPEKFSQFVANGKVETEFVPVESEHSAMSACVGAAATGVRTMTATASQGLALMHEVLFNASGLRLPIVLLNANRALSAPLSIHGDHSDSMAERDSGWIQIYADSPQEAYDLTLQAFPIAENSDVRLPVMVCFDGFDTSHLVTNLEILEDEIVKKFIGEIKQINPLFDLANPATYGAFTNPDFYFECRRGQHEGFIKAPEVIKKIGEKYSQISGRKYGEPIETYKTEDAEIIAVIIGSASGMLHEAVDKLRGEGKKVGMIRVRTFRPFPAEEIVSVLKNTKKIAIFDRTMPSGAVGGPLFNEINSALYSTCSKRACPSTTSNWIFGIGQRQFTPAHVEEVFAKMESEKFEQVNFVNLRE